jgi:hypothetical protein
VKRSSDYKLQTRPLVREGAPITKICKCIKIISKIEKEKLVMGLRWWPGTRTDWPTDRQSLGNIVFDDRRVGG